MAAVRRPPLTPRFRRHPESSGPAEKTDTGASERNAADAGQRRDPNLDSRSRIGVLSQQS